MMSVVAGAEHNLLGDAESKGSEVEPGSPQHSLTMLS
jgi:hypothetical protein